LAPSWTRRALADLEAIADFISAENPKAAETWVNRLFAAAERAAKFPRAGRRVPELARDDAREILLKSYRLVYLLTESRIQVLTVFEGHRRFPKGLLVRKPPR
jgi:plasmid stabilization system protein ParE